MSSRRARPALCARARRPPSASSLRSSRSSTSIVASKRTRRALFAVTRQVSCSSAIPLALSACWGVNVVQGCEAVLTGSLKDLHLSMWHIGGSQHWPMLAARQPQTLPGSALASARYSKSRIRPVLQQQRTAGLRQRQSMPSRINARGELLTLRYASYNNPFHRRAHSSVVLAGVQRSAQPGRRRSAT
jgi:hypothetical protein